MKSVRDRIRLNSGVLWGIHMNIMGDYDDAMDVPHVLAAFRLMVSHPKTHVAIRGDATSHWVGIK
jgi:hypothetical protein